MRFDFVGELIFGSADSRSPSFKKGKTSNGSDYKLLNITVKAAENNRAYCSMFGMCRDVITTTDVNGDSIEIDWEDRNDPDIIDTVSFGRKYVIAIDDDRHTFITEYDFINYVAEHVDEFKSKRLNVRGSVRKELYKGKVTDRFNIQSIYALNERQERQANKLNVLGILWYTKDSFDFSEWKDERKIIINAYTEQYIDRDEGVKCLPHTVNMKCKYFESDDEDKANQTKLWMNTLMVDAKGDKINTLPKLKSKNVYSMSFRMLYNNGAEEEEFTEDSLTPLQKQFLKSGGYTLDDFRPKGTIYGNRKVTYNIVKFDITGKYEDGAVEEMTVNEFEDEKLYIFAEDEKIESVVERKADPVVEDDEDDLFS